MVSFRMTIDRNASSFKINNNIILNSDIYLRTDDIAAKKCKIVLQHNYIRLRACYTCTENFLIGYRVIGDY